MAVDTRYLGKGLRFPFQIATRDGGIGTIGSTSLSEGEDRIIQSIKQILGTPIKRRFMRRDFGSRLNLIPFEPNDEITAVLIKHYIREALAIWEKRIYVGSITVDFTDRDDGLCYVGITFRIIKTNKIGNMVYPFYLRRL